MGVGGGDLHGCTPSRTDLIGRVAGEQSQAISVEGDLPRGFPLWSRRKQEEGGVCPGWVGGYSSFLSYG